MWTVRLHRTAGRVLPCEVTSTRKGGLGSLASSGRVPSWAAQEKAGEGLMPTATWKVRLILVNKQAQIILEEKGFKG